MKIKNPLLALLLLITFNLLNAGNPSDPKKFVSKKDVFGTRNFIENKGQYDNALTGDYTIEAVLDNGQEKIYFTNKGLVYELIKRFPMTEEQREEMEKNKHPKLKEPKIYHVNMNWLNANPNISIEKSERQSHYFTYGEAKYNSYAYKKLTYKNVYPNIDIEYTIPEDRDHGIKYNVIVNPGANVADIKIAYTGDVDKIKQSNDGSILIKTPLEDIIEHTPNTFYENKETIESAFTLKGDIISFSLPKGYDQNKTLIIDPFVSSLTSLTANNLGFDVDYDYSGNTYVFGGSSAFKVAMYNSSGVLQWTFSGTLVTPAWSTDLGFGGIAGNFAVNKATNKTYVAPGGIGSIEVVRLDAAGNYDGFISAPNVPNFTELWDMGFICATNEVVTFGGDAGGVLSAVTINTITGSVSTTNFLPGNTNIAQDVGSHAIDDAGNIFVMYTDALFQDSMCAVNSTFNGNLWYKGTTFPLPLGGVGKWNYQGFTGTSLGFNCLAVNNNFLFYYDGSNLAAYSKATGVLTASTTVPSLTLMLQGGIAVDDCNNLYLGGNGSILCYNFTGTAFNPLPNIPLGAQSANPFVFDIKLDKPNKLLYVSGNSFVGTYSAINTLTCPTAQSICYVAPPVQNSIICAGTTATLNSVNFLGLSNPTYSLNPGGLFSANGSFVVTPTSNISYTTYITGTNIASGAVQTTSTVINVTLSPQPIVNPVLVQSSCTSSLSSFNLGLTFNPSSPVPSYTVSWLPSAPNGITSNTQTSLSGAINPGTYTANIVAAGGCATSTVITINPIPPTPSFTIVNTAGSASITCATPSIVLNSLTNYNFGTLTYFWSSNSFTSSAQSVTVTSPSTLITLQVVDPVTGCAATRTTVIFQNTVVPTCSATPLNQVVSCGPGVVATVTASIISPTVNTSFALLSPNAPVPSISAGLIAIYNPVVGTSTLTCINNVNGCVSNPILINVTSLSGFPTFSVNSVLSSNAFTLGCSTRSITDITIVNPNTNPPGGSPQFTILPPSFTGPTYTYNAILTQTFNTPGNYTVIVRDANNLCETRVTIPLIQNTTPPNILATTLTRTLTCFTPSVTLEASSSTSPVAYNWSFQNGGNPNNIPNPIITVTANLSQTALTQTIINTYTLTITNQNNLCTSNTVIVMAQNVRPPNPVINGTGSLTCLTNKFTLANGSNINPAPGFFSPLGTQATLWQGPTPQIDLINSSFYEGFTAGIYTMTVMDLNNGCKTQTTTVIGDSRNYPVLNTNTLVALDCGANLTGVTLSVTALNLKASDVTARWTTLQQPVPNIKGQNTMTLTTDGIGNYILTVTTNSNGCSSNISVRVINGKLNGAFSTDPTDGFAPLNVNFKNLSSSTSSISGTSSITSVWSFGNGTTRTTTSNISTSALYAQPGTYTVILYASKGTCLDTAMATIKVDIPSKLEVPNVFTPNGDNSNDVFFVKSANLTEITALIYDRWGNKVYELTTDKGNIAWDGKTQSGKEAAEGTYFYVITAKGKDGQSYDTKGTVSLMR